MVLNQLFNQNSLLLGNQDILIHTFTLWGHGPGTVLRSCLKEHLAPFSSELDMQNMQTSYTSTWQSAQTTLGMFCCVNILLHTNARLLHSAFSSCLHAMWAAQITQHLLKSFPLFLLIGEGNGNPLQYSCLENPIDRGAWWGLQSMVSQRVRQDWVTNTHTTISIIFIFVLYLYLWMPITSGPM